MIRQLWTLSVQTRAFLRRYMPTNILLDAIRTRRGLKWGVPAMLLAVPYLLAASTFTTLCLVGVSGSACVAIGKRARGNPKAPRSRAAGSLPAVLATGGLVGVPAHHGASELHDLGACHESIQDRFGDHRVMQ